VGGQRMLQTDNRHIFRLAATLGGARSGLPQLWGTHYITMRFVTHYKFRYIYGMVHVIHIKYTLL